MPGLCVQMCVSVPKEGLLYEEDAVKIATCALNAASVTVLPGHFCMGTTCINHQIWQQPKKCTDKQESYLGYLRLYAACF